MHTSSHGLSLNVRDGWCLVCPPLTLTGIARRPLAASTLLNGSMNPMGTSVAGMQGTTDGALEFEDFVKLSRAVEASQHSESVMRERFYEFAGDDGTIDMHHYIGCVIIEALTGIGVARLLGSLDSEGTGELNRAQFSRSVEAMGIASDAMSVGRVLRLLDAEGNGECVQYETLLEELTPDTVGVYKRLLEHQTTSAAREAGMEPGEHVEGRQLTRLVATEHSTVVQQVRARAQAGASSSHSPRTPRRTTHRWYEYTDGTNTQMARHQTLGHKTLRGPHLHSHLFT